MTPEQYTRLNEGCKYQSYQDQNGVWTVGIGCTGPTIGPNTTWTSAQVEVAFEQRYQMATNQACADLGKNFWATLDVVRQAVLADMAFQMGGAGLADFHQMLSAIEVANWQVAHDECLASKYYRDTPARCQRSATMLLTGQWPMDFNG